MNARHFFSLSLAAILGGAISLGGYHWLVESRAYRTFGGDGQPAKTYLTRYDNVSAPIDFVAAAAKVTPAVVHIKTTYKAGTGGPRSPFDEMFREYFGDRMPGNGPERASSGSGVIISADGYIVTNNHVIDQASEIEVVLIDKHSFKAKVVGTDPTTDLALLKVEATELPFLQYGDSDQVQIGQWVLAVGNPFDLTSTVTAGIVSAKARNIDILRTRDRMEVESFIQTDAAVNPGNSGGALVDVQGRLIGINTAIATQTGSYSGYSFAVPVTLVRKVMEDLANYGQVQRGLLGVSIQDVNAKLAEEKSLESVQGVYVAGIAPGGGAEDAGLKEGDVILSVNEAQVNSVSELQEQVARRRPGDRIKVSYRRGKQILKAEIQLKNKTNGTGVLRKVEPDYASPGVQLDDLGAEAVEITPEQARELGVSGGVQITGLSTGKLQTAGVEEGFIITKVDKKPVRNLADFRKALEEGKKEGALLLEGAYPSGEKEFYALRF